VWIIGLRIGPAAATADVMAHQRTLALMRRYNGVLGRLQRLVGSPPAPGSEAWTAWLETEKLSRLVAQRQAAMTGLPPGDVADEIEREIAELEIRLSEFEPALQRRGADARIDAVGSVGSPDLSGSGRTRAVPASIERIASEPPPLQRQIDGVTRVEKGPAYEDAMQDLRQMYGRMEAEAQEVVAVRGQRTDGASRWSYGHDARQLSHGVTAVEVRIRLDGAVNAIPPDEMLRLRQNIVAGVDRYYNFQHDVSSAAGGASRLHVEISFVEDPSSAHLNVMVHRGEGYADLKNWFVEGNPTTHAHEIGHGGFGLWDEYVDERNPWRSSPTAPLVRDDSSLMGNYWVDGQPFGPVVPETSLRGRHLDEISGDIAERRASSPAGALGAEVPPRPASSTIVDDGTVGMSGGRHGVDRSSGLELLTDPHPPPEVAALQKQLGGIRIEVMANVEGGSAFRRLVRELLGRRDSEIDAVMRNLASNGRYHIDRAELEVVFDYLFQSQGIRLDYVNYAAWRRLSCGAGSVDDVRFVMHELAEQRALRGAGFTDTLGPSAISAESIDQWRNAFQTAYFPAHDRALAVEARFVADEVARRTDGLVRLSAEDVALSDPTRLDEMRTYLHVDGVPVADHPSATRWQRGDEPVKLSPPIAASLGLRQDTNIRDVIVAVKRSKL
jgi:hypothetical protein